MEPLVPYAQEGSLTPGHVQQHEPGQGHLTCALSDMVGGSSYPQL